MISNLPNEIFNYIKTTDESLDLTKYADFFFDELMLCNFTKVYNNNIITTVDRNSLEAMRKITNENIAYLDAKKQEIYIKKIYHKDDILIKNKTIVEQLDFTRFYVKRNDHEQYFKSIICINNCELQFAYGSNYDIIHIHTAIEYKNKHNYSFPLIYYYYSERHDNEYLMSHKYVIEFANEINLQYDTVEDIFDFLTALNRCHHAICGLGSFFEEKSFHPYKNFIDADKDSELYDISTVDCVFNELTDDGYTRTINYFINKPIVD